VPSKAAGRCHFNAIDPAVTFACLADQTTGSARRDGCHHQDHTAGGGRGNSLKQAETAIAAPGNLARILPFRPVRAGLIATMLPTLKASVMDKTRVAHGQQAVARAAPNFVEESRVAHAVDAVAAEIVRMAGET
jgi:molybdenum cofactor cytidylyltransferase